MTVQRFILILFAVLSLLTFFAYGIDKLQAKSRKRRTPEVLLLSLALCGGAAGALLGMLTFRHKTRHLYFWILNILFSAAHMALIWKIG